MTLPSAAALGLPRGAIVAVPASGLVLYRVAPAGVGRGRAPEPPRLGVSRFLSPEAAAAIMTRPGRVARVSLKTGHAARAGGPGHVTVWAPADELARVAEPVE